MATLEVLLREDVDNLGRRGEIVRVKAGYARNYLLPRKLAMVATATSVKTIEQERRVLQKREGLERFAAQSLGERLRSVSLEFERKAGEQGIFYGSVTTHDIAHALAEQGLEVERRKIHLEHPIKQPGTYTVTVKLHRDVVIEIPVTAKREGGEETPSVEASAPSTTTASETTPIQAEEVESETEPKSEEA
jgi:large subunit ribosomal protein L9